MLDVGDIVGSLMSGLIHARRMADEQTAALAEYYLSNPLLEGLSVPRIRIPELTIDMPLLINGYQEPEPGAMGNIGEIVAEATAQIRSNIDTYKLKVEAVFFDAFDKDLRQRLVAVQQSKAPILKETILRAVLGAVTDALTTSKTALDTAQRQQLVTDLRARVARIDGVLKPFTRFKIEPNVKTADVKEQGSSQNVVRLKITLKEEGLEWNKRADESGGIVRSLQVE